MKRAKKLYILLGVLAAACLATVIALRVEEYKEQIRTSDEIILEIPTEEVDALSWEYQEDALAFHKEEDTWLYDQDEAFPVDPERSKGSWNALKPLASPLSSRTWRITANMAWRIPFVPSGFPAGIGNIPLPWGILAPWIPSGMCPSGTEMPTWWQRIPWRILTQCFRI